MRVLCDVHIPYGLVRHLRGMGVDATHVNRILDGSRTSDSAIASFVDANGMLLITKDSDFRDSHWVTGSPARLLRITLGNLSNAELIQLVERHWQLILALNAGGAYYAELSRRGLVRFPDGQRVDD